jgi:predicted MFS family arabinose efflux permease
MLTTVLRHRDFRRLWVATTIDAFGSWLLVMAVPLQVFALTGSAMSTGLALAVQAVPAAVIGPWAGVAVDRWDRRTILVLANLASAAGVGLMLPATAPGRAGLLFVGLLVESSAVCFLRPALRAVTPTVVPTEGDLAAANSLAAFGDSALRMIGPVIGTFLVARGWFAAVVIIDAGTYAVAAALITRVTIAAPAPPVGRRPHVGHQLRDGLRQVLGAPPLPGLLATSWVYWTGNAALTALLVPFTATRLHGSGQALGYLIAGLGVGYLAGSAISRPLILRYAVRSILTVAYTSVGLCFIVLVNATALPVAVAAVTAAGVPGVVALIAIGQRLQTATPSVLLGRVAAVFYTSDAVAAVAGALLAAATVMVTGLGVALNAFSVVVLLTGPMAAVLLHPRTRRPLRSHPA